jgi:hypothetical protein
MQQWIAVCFFTQVFRFVSWANGLGWEFRFLVPISGTPIVSRITILCLIQKIPVGIFFEILMSGESENWNSDLQYLEFW